MSGKTITITASDGGKFGGFLALAQKSPAPGVVNCNLRASFNPDASKLARTRTMELLHRTIGP